MFETKSTKQVLTELNVDAKHGLPKEEVANRRAKYGPNKLIEKKKVPIILAFFSNFNDPMIYILLTAALLSVAVSIFNVIQHQKPFEFADPIIIMGVIFLNAIISTVQESKAEKSLEALKKMSSPTCLVKRDGHLLECKAEQ